MSESLRLVVGSLTRPVTFCPQPQGEGISIFALDEDDGALRLLDVRTAVDNPCFLALDERREMVYATTEVHEWREGLVTAWALDGRAERLEYRNMQPTLGVSPAHLAVCGDRLYVANYAFGDGGPDQSVAALGLAENGTLQPARASVRFSNGTGPVRDRQDRSHPHCVLVRRLPGGGVQLVVADLGTDRLELLVRVGASELTRTGAVALPPGSGPRHLAWHPGGGLLFVVNELAATLSTLLVQDDAMTVAGTLSLLPPGFERPSFAADVAVAADGRFLCASNRGADTIAVVALGRHGVDPTLVASVPCGGRTPRSIALTPTGRHLVVANQDSDSLDLFERHPQSGALSHRASRAVGTPTCVRVWAPRT